MNKPWYSVRKPQEITDRPWLHPEVVEYLEGILDPEWCVLEHGAGGSTLWFAERVKSVVSIEHSPGWTMAVRERAPANVTLLASLPRPDALPGYDLFLIDGERKERAVCLKEAQKFVKPGGWIVLDNANRPEYEQERDGLRKFAELVERFDRNAHAFKYLVTEFWQCG